jgi:hypothetical protein
VILSPFSSARGSAPVRLVVVHTAEGARTVESLGAWFQRSSTQASSHAGIDDCRIETYVEYARAAWTVRNGNPISDNVELCGFAAWSREEWLNNHPNMLKLTAQWIRERCLARGIPIKKLTPAEVAAGKAGVIGHVDWTLGMKDGSHTDPGPGFPWDHVIQLAAGTSSAAATTASLPEGDDIVTAIPIKVEADGSFKELVMAECGDVSGVVKQAWITAGAAWGATAEFTVTALDDSGKVLGQQKKWTAANNRRGWCELPNNTVMATIEGKTTGPKIAAALVSKAK